MREEGKLDVDCVWGERLTSPDKFHSFHGFHTLQGQQHQKIIITWINLFSLTTNQPWNWTYMFISDLTVAEHESGLGGGETRWVIRVSGLNEMLMKPRQGRGTNSPWCVSDSSLLIICESRQHQQRGNKSEESWGINPSRRSYRATLWYSPSSLVPFITSQSSATPRFTSAETREEVSPTGRALSCRRVFCHNR